VGVLAEARINVGDTVDGRSEFPHSNLVPIIPHFNIDVKSFSYFFHDNLKSVRDNSGIKI